LLCLPVRLGERLLKFAVTGSLTAVHLAVQDLLGVDLRVLISFGSTALPGRRNRFSVLCCNLLFDDVDGAGATFEIRDVLRRFCAKLRE
jgi:hypothetical protein